LEKLNSTKHHIDVIEGGDLVCVKCITKANSLFKRQNETVLTATNNNVDAFENEYSEKENINEDVNDNSGIDL
jgi:hypothetical protein